MRSRFWSGPSVSSSSTCFTASEMSGTTKASGSPGLRTSCPRSLIHCVHAVEGHLTELARAHGRRTAATSAAGGLLAELAETDIPTIIEEGLHEFLTRFVRQNAGLADRIGRSYLFGKV